jgi:hypothetical protein
MRETELQLQPQPLPVHGAVYVPVCEPVVTRIPDALFRAYAAAIGHADAGPERDTDSRRG